MDGPTIRIIVCWGLICEATTCDAGVLTFMAVLLGSVQLEPVLGSRGASKLELTAALNIMSDEHVACMPFACAKVSVPLQSGQAPHLLKATF